MNNTANMNMNVNYGRRTEAKAAPAWLVMLAHIILWFTKEETKNLLRASTALFIILIVAVLAGGIGCGLVSLGRGVLICGALVSVAFLLTRDFV